MKQASDPCGFIGVFLFNNIKIRNYEKQKNIN